MKNPKNIFSRACHTNNLLVVPIIPAGVIVAVINIGIATNAWSQLDWEGWEGYRSMVSALGIIAAVIVATVIPIGVAILFLFVKLNKTLKIATWLFITIATFSIHRLSYIPPETMTNKEFDDALLNHAEEHDNWANNGVDWNAINKIQSKPAV